MINQGSKGSLSLFYKDLLIGSYPLTKKKDYHRYKYQGEYLILKTMNENKNMSIKKQIYTYTYFINSIYKRKKENLNIWRSDYELFLSCMFALIKLKILDEDDSIFIMPKKKKKIKA